VFARTLPPVLAAIIAITLTAPHARADTRPNPYVRSIPAATITVSAASSLTDVFPVIAQAFTKRYPQLQVTFNFGSSNSLVEQIRAGAPVDVLVTADEVSMWRATKANLAETPILFARNTMAIATPKGNPARIAGLADLQKANVTVAVCAPQVPCGRLATELLAKNDLAIAPVTKEVDVRSVVGKVIADQVDAGIVYSTDIRAFPDDITGVSIPPAKNVITNYPIATVNGSRNGQAAKAFVDYVRYSSSAQGILRAWGFSKPW
jgi:molybdate transport system substrate-binding protein